MSKVSKAEQAEALDRLRKFIKPGDIVLCNCKHVSASGMSRVIQLYTLDHSGKGRPLNYIGWNVAKALGMSYDTKREGVKIGGCGMDMGFAIVYELGRALWPTKEAAEAAGYVTGRNSSKAPETDGGYILTHQWL